MVKKYTSKSDVAISVMLSNNESVHVAFSPVTGGGSVLYTDDTELQKALEKHRMYGHLFKLAETIEPKPKVEKKVAVEQNGNTVPKANKEIHVDNLDDAKEYLSDHYGLSRTKLRTKAQIMEAAAAKDITFVGI